jgi:hypothetical protein
MAVNYDDPSVAPAKSSAIHYKTLPCGMKVAISGYQAPIENTGRGTSGGKSNIVR